jgi:2-polyprenyl-3-methyl-5-hydroxy-6-metoxy-1,4-benzoquinol methylase
VNTISKPELSEIAREWQGHQGLVVGRANDYDLIDCQTCGFIHTAPIPAPEELEALYRQHYYLDNQPDYLDRHLEDLDWWNTFYRERYETFEELLPRDRRRLLDVGSGFGLFLQQGQRRGWDTLGIEPSKDGVSYSRGLGLEVIEDFLSADTASRLGKFDVVHLSEVLEHIPDPTHLLHLARQLLSPGGLVCVVVANDCNPFQSALQTACGYAPWWMVPPFHINYFTFDSLSNLIGRCGFEVVLREGTFPMELFLLMGDRYVGNDLVGRQCHDKRKRFEHHLEQAGMGGLKRQLYRALATLGLGREAMIFGRADGGRDHG